MIKLIIFDIGGVVIDFTERQYINYITKKLRLNSKRFSRELIPLINKMELGAMTLDELENKMSKSFKIKKGSLEWDSSLKELAKENKSVKNLINNLSRKYVVVLLSNVSRSRYIVIVNEFLKNIKVNRTFASCYIKMRKPDVKIYRYVLKTMKVKSNEAIFIDNLKENTDGAKRIGIKSIQFKNYKQLKRDLSALKIRM